MISIAGLLPPYVYAIILFVFVIFVFVNPKIPNYVAALFIPFYCAFTGVMTVPNVLVYYANTTLWLVLCMQMFGAAFFEVGLADDVGNFMYKIIATSKVKNPETLCIAVIMIVTGVCSMFLQNLGVTLAFIPVVLALAEKTGISRTKLLILLPVATALGGASTLTGTPMHAVINGSIAEYGIEAFGMFDYAYTAVPIWIICLVVYIIFHKKLFCTRYQEDPALVGNAEYVAKKSGTKYQKTVVGIGYLLFIAAIIFKNETGITECAAGMVLIVLIYLFRGLPIDKMFKAVKPSFMLQSAGILAMVSILGASGAADVMIKPVITLLGEHPQPVAVVAAFYLIAAILTQFMTNNYVALLCVPLAVPYCQAIGMNPAGVVMAILMGCNNCLCTPMATPANLVVMEDGHIEFTDYLKPGIVLMLIGLVVNVILIPIVWF